ncbi:amidohydrolase 2 [Gregarina niphandrodes]|uniref:6-methylsalicylate decarboxylase n=1 Tax=Gregarina niphandrodes TaxID=110365 RepID=A0A023B0C8_GRENI|nr:amidohydrolase 2 [Gregarina niphandrodes]EZG45146.1 amidohydrolase 2 [Gregarina niphandrodes]|eukprot:XP_011132547.1 amidohydrolase 2 [Gregarina niphandrodes]
MQEGKSGRIDVHVHYLPSKYREAVIAAGHGRPDGMPYLPEWSVESTLAMMDGCGISKAVLSVSSPGVYFGDDAQARALSRYVNQEGAKAVASHPDRLGFFASLPLPDVSGALEELSYALDELKADGVVIESNSEGIYPGDPQMDPVLAEMDKRKTVLFMHPTSPHCAGCDMRNSTMGAKYPGPMIEFLFETTRAVCNMIIQNTFNKFPNIRWIIPHAGAVLPIVIDRVVGISTVIGLSAPLNEAHVLEILNKLYFDLAGMPLPRMIKPLLEIADPDKLLYGSDWPFTPEPLVKKLAIALDHTDQLADDHRHRIMCKNALPLFPRFN